MNQYNNIESVDGKIILMEDVGLDLDTPITQYLKYKHLESILKDNLYCVKKKKTFKDKREKNYPFFRLFEIKPIGDRELPSPITVFPDKLTNSTKQYKKYSELLTSCWTTRTSDNILMWDRYSDGTEDNDGEGAVRIVSTIRKFSASFINPMYYFWCGRMFYDGFNGELQPEIDIWKKELAFSDERELRFYFSKELMKIVPDDKLKVDEDMVFFTINPNIMIEKIILSPYTKDIEKKREYIQKTYNICTEESSVNREFFHYKNL